MNKFFFGAAGAVLALWFVSVCNEVPLFFITLPVVTTLPYRSADTPCSPNRYEQRCYRNSPKPVYIATAVVEKPPCYRQPMPINPCRPTETRNDNENVMCQLRHVVGLGETQWQIASYYAGAQNKAIWLRNMRYISHLAVDDSALYPGQVLCVQW